MKILQVYVCVKVRFLSIWILVLAVIGMAVSSYIGILASFLFLSSATKFQQQQQHKIPAPNREGHTRDFLPCLPPFPNFSFFLLFLTFFLEYICPIVLQLYIYLYIYMYMYWQYISVCVYVYDILQQLYRIYIVILIPYRYISTCT